MTNNNTTSTHANANANAHANANANTHANTHARGRGVAITLAIAAIAATLAITSCGVLDPILGGGDGNTSKDSSTITINLDGEANMFLGDTTVLSVTIDPPPPDNINIDDILVWTTTSVRVVSINLLNGEATLVALDLGETTIAVTHKPSGATSSIRITTHERPR